jgi:hypothetical protein
MISEVRRVVVHAKDPQQQVEIQEEESETKH